MNDINPYQILGVTPDTPINQVKDIYRQLAQKHHPDKGGNPETFAIIKLAFKMIVDSIKKGVKLNITPPTFTDMKDASQNYQPAQYPNQRFDSLSFNQKFIQHKKEEANDILSEDYREQRTEKQLMAEQDHIDKELSKIQPIFHKKNFNPNVFNRLFEQVNGKPEEKKELQVYEEPQALTSGFQPYTEINNDKKTNENLSFGFSKINEGFGEIIPNKFDHNVINNLSQQPDITIVNTIEDNYYTNIKNKMNDYRNTPLMIHPKPSNPSQFPPQIMCQNANIDKISKQGLDNSFNAKLQERNGLFQNPSFDTTPQSGHQAQTISIMDYPKNSNIQQQQQQQQYELLNPYTTGTPTYNSQPSNSPNDYFMKIPSCYQYQNNETKLPNFTAPQQPTNVNHIQQQLRVLQNKVNNQKKLIHKLTTKK